MSVDQLPTQLDRMQLQLCQKKQNDYRFRKKDRVWRVLKFGRIHTTHDRYLCINYKDYWLTVVLHDGQPQVVSGYICEEWPVVNPTKLRYSDHAEEQMSDRGIQKKDVLQLFKDCIVYDRTSKNKFRFTSIVWGEKLNVVVDVPNDTVVTVYWN